jgi:ribosomal protein L29|tara:strand:- start:478 stop:696 length:219 start_codon:yes stop_codon:yes gene_type:complete
MPVKKTAAEECCAKCEKDIAALRKEVAALKKELAKAKGGADPRVDAIAEYLKLRKSSDSDKSEKLKKLLNKF